MSDVKQISIKGDAAHAYLKEGKKGTRRRQRQEKRQDGGFDSPPGAALPGTPMNAKPMINAASKTLRGGSGQVQVQTQKPLLSAPGTNQNLPAGGAGAGPAIQAAKEAGTLPPPLPMHNGGAKKLVLAPHKKPSRVHLAPPKRGRTLHTRKIRVHLSGLKKRITRAKSIHKDSREKSINEIRVLLEEAKLIKPAKDGKTVPESVLRDIYKDYMLLRGKAL
jgi:hypothetical protein